VDFELHRNDLHETRFRHDDAPSPNEGQALLRVDSFGLTSNNITYAVFGDAMKYWDFFPTPDPDWGKLNVWGYARVDSSRHPDLAPGMRVYGYLPSASHVLVVPDRIDSTGFVDAATHRTALPSAYQGYRNVATDLIYSPEHEATHLLFFPLFVTSYLIDDLLTDEAFFGADTIVISSASSKTAIIAAFLLAKRNAVSVVGLTSAANQEFVEGLGIYDSVVRYDNASALPGEHAAYVDISGNGAVRSAVHARYGVRLAHSAAVGMTHWTAMGHGVGDLAGPKPSFFFAPDRITKRSADWGRLRLDENIASAWGPFAAWAADLLRIERISTEDDIRRTYLELLDGRADPAAGVVVSLQA
jgi:hypothetical protein